MKHWLLIAGYQYYPGAGTEDWKDTFHSWEEAKSVVKEPTEPPTGSYVIYGQTYDWYQIVDLRDWINRPARQPLQRG